MPIHLGLSNLIPLIIFIGGFVVSLLAMFIDPIIGVLFFFPLLPFQIIFEKIHVFPFGKDLINILTLSIIVGGMLKRHKINSVNNEFSRKIGHDLLMPIICVAIISFIGLINATVKYGLSLNLDNLIFADWKNYILLPVICLLTFNNVRDLKTHKLLTSLLIIGIFFVSYYYFFHEVRGRDFSHFSEQTRDKMTGLFVYLGPNHYGAFFAHFIFIIIGLSLFIKSKRKKIALLLIGILTLLSLIFSLSRGAYAAFLLGILFVGLIKEKKIIILLIVFLIFWQSLVPKVVNERIEMTQDDSGQLEVSSALRIEIWQEALSLFMTSPIIGVGFNTFHYKGFSDTHNIYFKMLSELGILGLLSFLFICISSFVSGIKLYTRSNNNYLKGLGLGFAACVISLMVSNVFGNRWSYLSLGSYFWIFWGLVARGNIINDELMSRK